MVQKVTDQEFSKLIQTNEKVIVKFYADWCGSCRLFAPKYTKISNKSEYSGALFLEINAEENPEARKFASVNNLPFFAAIKNGVLVSGDTTAKEESVEKIIQQVFN
ncbi:MAG: thioredoxin family protein [Bacteroidota bacterium]|nr:thioredoxin family protein [Bacteroidota bacterium]